MRLRRSRSTRPEADVPVTIQNEAVVRLAGYLFDATDRGARRRVCQCSEKQRRSGDLIALSESTGPGLSRARLRRSGIRRMSTRRRGLRLAVLKRRRIVLKRRRTRRTWTSWRGLRLAALKRRRIVLKRRRTRRMWTRPRGMRLAVLKRRRIVLKRRRTRRTWTRPRGMRLAVLKRRRIVLKQRRMRRTSTDQGWLQGIGCTGSGLALTARVASLEAAIAALPSGGDAGEIKVLFAVAAVEGGWQEITLTEEIPENTLVEFRLGSVGLGAGAYGLATASAIEETTPVAAAPGDYTGALPLQSMDADDVRFGHDVRFLFKGRTRVASCGCEPGVRLRATWQIKAFPIGTR